MEFAEALLSCDNADFERILYDEIRTQAFTVCAPQVVKPPENLGSDSAGESDFESGKSEYCALEKTIFRSFEQYIAGRDIMTSTEDSGECANRLECHLRSCAIGQQGICGRIFQANEPTYCCRDCAVDPTCVLCRACFFNSAHMTHNYKISTSSGVGYCDCGDPEAWRSDAWCKLHTGSSEHREGGDKEEEVVPSELADINDIDAKLKAELDNLRQRINSLPPDVVERTGRLLKPLLNSAALCLTDLIQGAHRLTTEALSSRLRKGGTSVTKSSSETGVAEEQDVIDDLWSTDDGVVKYTSDNENVWDSWPPQLSHIPLVLPAEDAVVLGQDAWPRTASGRRSSEDVEARCLAQLERARIYHPRLFPPRSMRTASDRTAASRAFLVVLYNNEFHNYEQVIKTLRRVLDCTTQQGTHHAVLVNCDGRTVLQMNLTITQAANLASALMRTSTSLSTRPLKCEAQHADIYSLEVFFCLFLRWLRGFCDQVPSLRPVICHAILGHFPKAADNAVNKSTQSNILPILPHDDTIKDDSFLSFILARHNLSWRSVRQEMLRLIMGVLLKDNFYRSAFAIKFTRLYPMLLQNYMYDDHLEGDNLCSLSCQFYTVTSLARQLLERKSILSRLLSRLVNAFEHNSIILPDFYSETTNQNVNADIQEELTVSNLNNDANTSWFSAVLDLLRRLNPFEWGVSTCTVSLSCNPPNCVSPQPRVLAWPAGSTLGRSFFHPFERLFSVIHDVDYILASLTNVRPLANNESTSSSSTTTRNSWWTEAARLSYIEYIRKLLIVLSFVQDMNGMQRQIQTHVEEELEWATGFYIMSVLISLLGLTVQVASSDYELYKLVLREARQAFETRIGILDRRFRIRSLLSIDEKPENNKNTQSNDNSNKLTFHSLGVTTEVYIYDVSVYRISSLQPIPRLLASLYGHGLEMGFTFDELGLSDKAFLNLLIERPLQILAFCAQYNAKMWVRNGYAAQQSVTNLFSSPLRVELVDRDIQLLQIASCVLPPDEFIIRLVHKFHLVNYLKSDAPTKEPGSGRVQAVEMLLRVLLACITNRSRPSIGQFTKEYYFCNNNRSNGSSNYLNDIVLDINSEVYYPNLISDVIHALGYQTLSYSELLSNLPYQATSSLLMKINIGQLDVLKQQHNLKDSDTEMTSEESQSTTSASIEIGPRPVLPASVSRSANKRAMETALTKILSKVAVQSSVNGRTVFSLRPEVLAYRFDRFYWGYRQPDQTTAEENVSKCLKKWIQKQDNPDLKNFPIPPPPPRPLHGFIPSIHPGPLRLLRCVTFVRLIKTLLEIANSHGTASSWWSHSLLDLVLHLIIVALYEDELEGSKTGKYPFLEAVARVPVESESDIKLRQLALSRHWLKPSPNDHLKISAALEDNCITSRLLRILNSSCHDDQSDLIRWTLNHWSKVVENATGDQTASETTNKPSPYQLCNTAIKQDRAEKARARRSRIMARMSNMQKNFMNSLSQNETAANESQLMDTDDPELNVNGNKQAMQTDPVEASSVQQCALGPKRLLGRAAFILDGLSPTPGGTSAAPNTELVTCNLCLEEMPEQVSSRMVMAAHVCRSSVLSSRGIGWVEGPVTMAVVRRLASEDCMIDSQASKPVDNQSQTENSDDLIDGTYRKQLLPFLASVATTSVAASRGSPQVGFWFLPEFIYGIRCLELKKDSPSEDSFSMDVDSDYSGMLDLVFAMQQLQETGPLILDPWYPRPLVSSRDPIAEEGSFFTFCSHPMHTTCKTKYARQLKGRVDHINRRNSSVLAFDFRCPLCKCISTLDLPILGPVYSDLPVEWLSLRLLSSGDRQSNHSQSNPNNVDFQPLMSWLWSLARWLEMFSDSRDYLLGDLLPSDCYPSTEYTMIEPHLLEDYAIWHVNHMFSMNVNLIKQSLRTHFSQPLNKILVDLDVTLPSLEALGMSENCEIVSKLIQALDKRIRHSFIIQEENNDDNGRCTSQVDSNNASSRRNISSSSLNPMSRHFSTNRRSTRRSSDTVNVAANSSNSANNNNAAINGRDSLRNLLPSPSSPLVSSNLFTFVQRLAGLCQPRSLDSLVQRPNIRRGTEVAEVVVNNGPAVVNIPDDDNQIIGYVEADDDVQVNLYANNPALSVGDQNVQLVISQAEYNSIANDNAVGVSVTPTVTSPNTEQSPRNQIPASLNNCTISLSEAIQQFHLVFMNFYTSLHMHASSYRHTTTTIPQPLPATTPSTSRLTVSEPILDDYLTDTRGIITSFDFLKNSLEFVTQSARNVVWLASSEWRSLRHSVAYTLIVSERTLRLNGCRDNFFNGGLAERQLCGLGNLLRISFAAHSRHAVVSRGCPTSCDTNASEWSNHRCCWPQLKNHPFYWWWWCYCVPFDAIPKSQLKDIPSGCRLNNPPTVLDIAETVVSVAATEDAAFLWRLLIPLTGEYADSQSQTLDDDGLLEKLKQDANPSTSPYSISESIQSPPTSVLWDVDITFLFISLLHLRPGLEEHGLSDCQCTRLAQEADSNIALESGAASLGAHLLACDEGRPRQPIGDSHETHLLRLCYSALLVQTILAWEPKRNCLDYLKSNNLIPESCTWDDASIQSVNWDLPELLDVWVFLRGLSGLPSTELPQNDPAYLKHLTQSLSLFLRANCLPFLRIAAFVMHKITGVDVPGDLRQRASADNMSDTMHEHSLLLVYLGLPSTPSDLLTLLSSPPSPSSSSSDLHSNALRSVSEAKTSSQSTNVSMLCESLWLARLITLWCLTGENSLSRKYYNSLCSRFIKSSLADRLLTPYPNVHLPRLIDLPKEYAHLLLLAIDMDCHAENHIHSDLSLCLVCGHLACLLCYGCRQFEQKSNCIGGTPASSNLNSNRNGNSSGSNQEFAVYRMQAHSRRCHSGYSFLLRIHSCRVIMLSDEARRITEVPAPYRDSFGETDPDLRRGNPLFLVESEYRHINKLWVSHQLTSSTSSDLVTPLNLQYGSY
ncbi:unnamed protein product [Trichobilharzia szidati]|nr:unnamed protein product [Trichobilharzia szidati]